MDGAVHKTHTRNLAIALGVYAKGRFQYCRICISMQKFGYFHAAKNNARSRKRLEGARHQRCACTAQERGFVTIGEPYNLQPTLSFFFLGFERQFHRGFLGIKPGGDSG